MGRTTVEEALKVIANEAIVLGSPFGSNPMARAGKALHDEIERLRECVKQRDKATADGDTCPMCGSPRTLVGPDSWSCNGCYPTCPKELYPLDPATP